MRDGTRLATDLYLSATFPMPVIAMRTPYGRAEAVDALMALAQLGYAVVSQDCRGTGDSEPDVWDMFVFEREDSMDFVEWIARQPWCNGFIASVGGSYNAATQWAMARHPQMSAIAPEVGGLCVHHVPVRHYMFVNAFSRSVGKGTDKVQLSQPEMERQMLEQTLAGGYFNEPLELPLRAELMDKNPQLHAKTPAQAKQRLWEEFCTSGPTQRAELIKLALGVNSIDYDGLWAFTALLGHRRMPGWVVLPSRSDTELARSLEAPAFLITGWYDWGLADALASWQLLMREASRSVSSLNRLLITPNAHNAPGYHEVKQIHPEIRRNHRRGIVDLRMHWFAAIRDRTIDSWPPVIYYLMGADEWYASQAWPPPEARPVTLYLHEGGKLTSCAPLQSSQPHRYTYDPHAPTPTVGGSIVSYVYPPGSVDVSDVQRRPDVVAYTSEPLDRDFDVVGPIRLILYASSSAMDTDFSARLTDVFPDGRAIQLQSGLLRTRYRNVNGEPELLEPGRIYRLEIDMWATANRFKAGHRLRLDISSADFPRFDRNANRGGDPGDAIPAHQTIYHDAEHPSHVLLHSMST